jgi:flavin-binding protein dodecin
MTVARVTRLTASSPTSWQDAVQEAANRANKTLRGLTGLEIVNQKAKIVDGKITEFRVTIDVTFILES